MTVGAGGSLVTHVGLTAATWKALQEPWSANEAADRINRDVRARRTDDHTGTLAPGSMLTGRPALNAGALWAEAAGELCESWWQRWAAGDWLPAFHQAHGHSSPVDWRTGGWRSPLRERVHAGGGTEVVTSVLPSDRRTRVEVATMTMFGTDPCRGKRPATSWSPLRLVRR